MTTPDQIEWLKQFQQDLEAEASTRPESSSGVYYTLRYQHPAYGYDLMEADTVAILNLDGYEISPEEALQDLLRHFPSEVEQASLNPRTGIKKASQWVKDETGTYNFTNTAQYKVADTSSFLAYLGENYPHIYAVTGTRYHVRDISGQIYLTRKHAQEELEEYDYDQRNIHPYEHSLENSPDLLKLLNFIRSIDLDKSTIVPKQH